MKEFTEVVTRYEANDGTIFDNQEACELHDVTSILPTIYVVHYVSPYSELPDVYFSSEKLALDYVGLQEVYEDSRYTIKKRTIDLLLYKKDLYEN